MFQAYRIYGQESYSIVVPTSVQIAACSSPLWSRDGPSSERNTQVVPTNRSLPVAMYECHQESRVHALTGFTNEKSLDSVFNVKYVTAQESVRFRFVHRVVEKKETENRA